MRNEFLKHAAALLLALAIAAGFLAFAAYAVADSERHNLPRTDLVYRPL
jgi:hypothetical protein